MLTSNQYKAIENIIFNCGGLKIDDSVLILCDASTRKIADEFLKCAISVNPKVKLMEIPDLPNHGAEPVSYAKEAMCRASLIFSLCRYSLAHSRARVDSSLAGARFLSLPLYDWFLLEDECLRIDYSAEAGRVRKFADAFTAGQKVHVTSVAGTNIRLEITGRIGNYCPGLVKDPGDLGSPPDIEANVSPIENSAEGVVIVDGSITMPGFGLLLTPVELEVRSGKVVEFRSDNSDYVKRLNQLFGEANSLRRVVAECGVGLNPAAKLTGSMLTDEGALGCVHFGLGSNYTVGGLNKVDFHLDFVFRDASLSVDGKQLINLGVPLL
jgi:leucyl aminopeptidase (aminopeptidase T)